MKLVTKDIVVDEEEFIAYQLLELVYGRYRTKIPKKSAEHLQQTLHFLLEDLQKDYPEHLDITDNKLIDRVTFNEDTLDDIKKAQSKKK